MTSKFNLPDAILLFLYADYHNQITGMNRLTAYAYMLEIEFGLVANGTVKLGSAGRGITSSNVNKAVDALVSANHIDMAGNRRSQCCSIKINRSGVEYIWQVFRGLPRDTIRILSERRHSWDTLTLDGVMMVLNVHYPGSLPKAVSNRYGGHINWDDV